MAILQDVNKPTNRGDEKSFGSPKKIGLLGPFGLGNLGDAAIQEAMIQNIYESYPNADVYGFSLNPEDTEKRHNIPSFPICRHSSGKLNQWWEGSPNTFSSYLNNIVSQLRFFPFRFISKPLIALIGTALEILAWSRAFNNLKGFDILIISGGGQLDDYFGGPWIHPYTLLMWAVLAKLRGVKYDIVSVGAGPLDYSLSRLLTKVTLSLASYRSYRDQDSKNYIEKRVGFKADDPVYPDLAYSLKLKKYQESATCPKNRENYRLVVGIGPMVYFAPQGEQGRDSSLYWEYLNKLAEFVSWLIQNKYAILFFSSETHEGIHDGLVIRDLRDLLDKNSVIYAKDQIIENPIQTVDDLMMQLSLTDVVVSTRFHGTLLPQLLNKPVLAIAHHRKVEMLMADSGLSDYCLTKATPNSEGYNAINALDVDALKERFIALEANQEQIKQQLIQHTQECQTALCEQYERLFGNL